MTTLAWFGNTNDGATCSVTLGSPVVTVAGSNLITGGGSDPGFVEQGFIGPDGSMYEILSVDSSTQLTLRSNYRGTTVVSAGFFQIVPVQGFSRDASYKLSQLLGYISAGPLTNVLTVKPGDNLQAAISAASGKQLVWMPGTYTTTGLLGTSNIQMIAAGPVTLNVTALAVALDFSNCNSVDISGEWTIAGTAPNYSGYPSAGITNSGQGGLKFVDSKRVNVDGDILITNMMGAAFDSQKPNHAFNDEHTNTYRGIRAKHCYRAFYIHNYSEYDSYSGIAGTQCIEGLTVESGNNSFSGMEFSYCNTNTRWIGGTNDGHDAVVNSVFNHGNVNARFENMAAGQHFTGCQFLADQAGSGHGIIQVVNSVGISFIGGGMGSDIAVDATSQVSCQGNFIRTAIANPPTVTAGGIYFGSGNFTTTGIFQGGWNNFLSWTPVLKFGGASVGIGYTSANTLGRYRVCEGWLEFVGQITLTSKGSSTGTATIDGLPFAAANIGITFTPISIIASIGVAVTDIRAIIAANSTLISLYNYNAGAPTVLNDTNFGGTDIIWFSGKIPLG